MEAYGIDSQSSSSSDAEPVESDARRIPMKAISELYGGSNQTADSALEPASELGNDHDAGELDSAQRQELINDMNENHKFVASKEVLAAKRRQLDEILKLRAKEEKLLVDELRYRKLSNSRQDRALFEISQLKSNSSGRFTIAETILMLRVLRQWGGHRKQKDIGDAIFDALKERGWQISQLDADEESLRTRVIKRLARVSQQSKDRIAELGSVGHVDYPWDVDFYDDVEQIVDEKLRSANPIARHLSKPSTDRRTLANNLKRIAYQPAELDMFRNWIASLKFQVIERRIRKAYSEHRNVRKPTDVIKKVKGMSEDMRAGRGYPSKLENPRADAHYDRNAEGLTAQGIVPIAVCEEFDRCLDHLVESRSMDTHTNITALPHHSDESYTEISSDSEDKEKRGIDSSPSFDKSVEKQADTIHTIPEISGFRQMENNLDQAGLIHDVKKVFSDAYVHLDSFYDAFSKIASESDGIPQEVSDVSAFCLALQGLIQETIGQFVVDTSSVSENDFQEDTLHMMKDRLITRAAHVKRRVENMLIEEEGVIPDSDSQYAENASGESQKPKSEGEDGLAPSNVPDKVSSDSGLAALSSQAPEENARGKMRKRRNETPQRARRRNKMRRSLGSPRTPEDRALAREAIAFGEKSIPRLQR